MLEDLHVRDLALIREAWLEFGPGLTVLTGETGAGKTALLGALKLLLGERADSTSVRDGAGEALAEGSFSTAGSQIIVKRRVSADGRSRVVIDGEMASVGGLTERIGPLVDLHGQHDHQALLSPSTHLGYLDRWAGCEIRELLGDYAAAFERHRSAARELDALERELAEADKNADYLAFIVTEIDRVDPQPGEDELLESRLPALQHAERLAEAASHVSQVLRGEGGALDSIAEASEALRKVSGIDDRLDALTERLTEASALIDDVGLSARAYRDGIAHDPEALNEALARLSALTGLKKKYGPELSDVLERRDSATRSLAEVEDAEGARRAAESAVSEAEALLRGAGAELARTRERLAEKFALELSSSAKDLAMEGARFEIAFTDLDFASWNAEGPHRVEFLYAPSASAKVRPLARIASGGEVSRTMLALKGVLGTADTVETLVFDEIDAGIGGATATAVGARLSDLAKNHQVIVVTHLAQVAAFADAHLVVEKTSDGGSATTTVRAVEGEDRVGEIARMLSGDDSETSRAHARELLERRRERENRGSDAA